MLTFAFRSKADNIKAHKMPKYQDNFFLILVVQILRDEQKKGKTVFFKRISVNKKTGC
jgi:hypothetical protein